MGIYTFLSWDETEVAVGRALGNADVFVRNAALVAAFFWVWVLVSGGLSG